MHLNRYALYLQNYGGPVGYRVAVAHPERVTALVIQNAIAHEEGLGRLQAVRKGFWADRAANEARYRAGLVSIDTARLRHVNGSPHPERYNPDLWNDEVAFLARPGEADIQSDLFYDYRNNIAAFPEWQNWLRAHRPPTLVVWGRYDPVFDLGDVEHRIIAAPDHQSGRAVCAQPVLPLREGRDIVAIVVEQVRLDIGLAGTGQERDFVVPEVGVVALRMRRTVDVPEPGRVDRDQSRAVPRLVGGAIRPEALAHRLQPAQSLFMRDGILDDQR